MEDIEKKLFSIINSNVDKEISIEQINSYTSLLELGINSIRFIKIIVAIEEQFDVEFEDELLDINAISNVKDLILIIQKKL